jgi:hypothetical protein
MLNRRGLTMPKYKVYSSQIVYHVLEVEAESEEQAEEIAFNNADDWQWFDCGNWQIENTEEV